MISVWILPVMCLIAGFGGYLVGVASGMEEMMEQWKASDRFLFKALQNDIERSDES